MAFTFYFFKTGFDLLAYFLLLLSEIAALMSGLMSYLPFHPPTVPGSLWAEPMALNLYGESDRMHDSFMSSQSLGPGHFMS